MIPPKEPEHMFPALQGLPDELRKLATEAEANARTHPLPEARHVFVARQFAFEQAAQMVEERLNG